MTTASDAQIVANLVVLSRAADKTKAALLIEGNKDGRLYRKVTDPLHCRLFAAGNRASAELAMTILESQGEPGVAAVVDADTDYLDAKAPSQDPNLLLTHTRDAEGIILQTGALRDVLIEFDLEGAFGTQPEVAATKASAAVAIVKFVSDQQGWQVRTSELDFGVFVDPTNLKCDFGALCKHMEALTMTSGVAATHYEQGLQKVLARGEDPFRLARGHDTTRLIAWAISVRRGKKTKSGAKTTSDIVESYLRTAYPSDSFTKCELFTKMEDWESKNAPFKLLRR